MITRLGFGGLRLGVKAFGLLLLSLVLNSAAYAQWTVVNLHPAAAAGSSFAWNVHAGQQAGFSHIGGNLHASLWSGTAESWVDLHPAGVTHSFVNDVRSGQQVGYVDFGDITHASLWSGSAESWVDLHPAGASGSVANAVDSGQQAGRVFFDDLYIHASLWSGSAESWVDLHPAGAIRSFVTDVDSGQQVGQVFFDDINRASLWSGSAESWVDLHPAGAIRSFATTVDSGQQVGSVEIDGIKRASLWSGSAESWVDLHPAGASRSYAFNVHAGQQVGFVEIDGINHASLWSGSAESWVDLHPTGASGSVAKTVYSGQQVGYTILASDTFHASYWSGTAESWVDLHAFLPAKFTKSFAVDIWEDGNVTYVVGQGFNSETGLTEALMWVGVGNGVAVEISSTPRVYKKNGQFGIGFWTSLNSDDPVELDLTISGFNQGDVMESLGNLISYGPTSQEWFFPFENYGINRFTDQEDLTVTVSATSGSATGQDQASLRIPLPTVIVQGILTERLFDGNVVPQELIDLLVSRGYSLDGPEDDDYPTLVVLADNYEYKPTSDTLAENAGQLQAAIFDYTHSPKTYASKVDIVAHSKGGLVARMYLNLYDINGFRVRRLIMAGSPHTGSARVSETSLNTRVIKEWAPTDPWYRRYRGGSIPPAFTVPGKWRNLTLENLNLWQMPASVDYYILYGTGYPTWANLSKVSPSPVSEWGFADGDGVVSQFSQRGFHIMNNMDGTVSRGARIQAFYERTVYEVPIGYPHFVLGSQGFLEFAKDTVYWSLSRD